MKKILFFLLALALFLIPLSSCSEEKPEVSSENSESGGIVYDSFAAADLDGNKHNESIFQGKKLTMINIWATFCGPCLNEMPALGRLAKAYGDDFQIVGIVSDTVGGDGKPIASQVKKANALAKQTGADYLHLVPGKDLQEIHIASVQAVPETVFLDENGRQVGETYVGSRSEAEWASIIEDLLEKLK